MELMKYTQGHTMVFYFKAQCTHFSPLSPTTSICFKGTTSRENFQKILTPSKITLPLHRFVKKFLKLFQDHGNYIASSPPPPLSQQTPIQSQAQANGRRSEYCLKGVLLLFKGKYVTIFMTLLCSGQQVLFKYSCCFPDFRLN